MGKRKKKVEPEVSKIPTGEKEIVFIDWYGKREHLEELLGIRFGEHYPHEIINEVTRMALETGLDMMIRHRQESDVIWVFVDDKGFRQR